MKIFTKAELTTMNLEDVQEHEREAWDYFKRVKTVMKFKELE